MKCEETEVYLSGYLDGELTQQARQPLEIHIRSCQHCQTILAQLREAQKATHQLELDEPKPEDWKIMEARILESISQGLGWSVLLVWLVVTSAYTLYQYAASPTEPLFEKILVFSLFLGIGLLFLSALSRRVREHRTDRYRGVMK